MTEQTVKVEYVWVRWRTKHSAGPGYWQWEEIALGAPCEEKLQIDAHMRYVADEHNTHSEHWRGIEWADPVPVPPRKELEVRIRRNKEMMDRALERVSRYEKLLALEAMG